MTIGECREMTIEELIEKLEYYAEKYGDDAEVCVLHKKYKDSGEEYTVYEEPGPCYI